MHLCNISIRVLPNETIYVCFDLGFGLMKLIITYFGLKILVA